MPFSNNMAYKAENCSSKYALTEILICNECGHPYRRQTWSKYGQKSAVWRCENRLKNGVKANCKNSPTLKEDPLHDAIMKAINSVIEDTGDFIGASRENVIRVIGGYSTKNIPSEYDDKIETIQNEILSLIEENASIGTVTEDFDGEYKRISEEIKELKRAKTKFIEERKQARNYKEKVDEMETTIRSVRPEVREFDQELVRRLINTIIVKKGEKLEIQFESGIIIKK